MANASLAQSVYHHLAALDHRRGVHVAGLGVVLDDLGEQRLGGLELLRQALVAVAETGDGGDGGGGDLIRPATRPTFP